MNATTFVNLAAQVTIPEDGTISRTLYQDERLKVVLFASPLGRNCRNTLHRCRRSCTSFRVKRG